MSENLVLILQHSDFSKRRIISERVNGFFSQIPTDSYLVQLNMNDFFILSSIHI